MTRNEAEESDEEEEEGEDEDEEEDEDEVGELADMNKPKRSKNKASKNKGSKGKSSSGAGEGEEGEEGEEEGAHSLIPVPGYSIDALSGTPDEFTVEFLTHRIYIQNELGAGSKVEPDKKEKNAEKVMDDIEKRRGNKTKQSSCYLLYKRNSFFLHCCLCLFNIIRPPPPPLATLSTPPPPLIHCLTMPSTTPCLARCETVAIGETSQWSFVDPDCLRDS